MLESVKGYRTYISAAAIFILGGLKALQVIDDAAFDALLAIFLGGGLAGLRAAK